jgi:hypothetical protein
MKRGLIIAVMALTVVFLGGCRHTALYENGNTHTIKPLIGMTMSDAIKALAVSVDQATIFDEPPGVARGFVVLTPDGTTIHLYFAKADRIFDKKCQWPVDVLIKKRVTGVEKETADGNKSEVFK